MIDCGENECYSCSKQYCENGCYNSVCSIRSPISDMSGNGCQNAHKCIGFISRSTLMNRQNNETNRN